MIKKILITIIINVSIPLVLGLFINTNYHVEREVIINKSEAKCLIILNT